MWHPHSHENTRTHTVRKCMHHWCIASLAPMDSIPVFKVCYRLHMDLKAFVGGDAVGIEKRSKLERCAFKGQSCYQQYLTQPP